MPAIASSQFIASLADVKLHLNISTTAQDSWLDKTIASMTKKIETFCNRRFKAATYTEFHDGNGKRGFIYVFNPPVGTVSVLAEDADRTFDSSTVFATSTYISYTSEGKVELLTGADNVSTEINPVIFGKGQQNVKIVYTGGYADIPEDVQIGALEWVATLNKVRDRKGWDVSNSNKGDVSTTYVTLGVMPEKVREFIFPYRMFRMGKRI